MSESLFGVLSRYKTAETRTPLENFATEALVYILGYVPRKARGEHILSEFLALAGLQSPKDTGARYSISSQTPFPTLLGRTAIPDITIWCEDVPICHIEVKIDSGERNYESQDGKILGQYKLYRNIRHKPRQTPKVVVLTKHACDSTDIPEADKLRWHSVTDFLRNVEIIDPVQDFLVNQYADFLGGNNMEHHQVAADFKTGISSAKSLLDQIRNALQDIASESGAKVKRDFEEDWLGYRLLSKSRARVAWVGLTFEEPDRVIFSIEDPKIAQRLLSKKTKGFVEISDNGNQWGDVHSSFSLTNESFYSLGVREQSKRLHTWIKHEMTQIGIVHPKRRTT